MIYPAQAVQKIRPDWRVELYEPGSVHIGTHQGRATAVQGLNPHGLDLLVLQRIGATGPLAFLQWAQAHGIATIVDSDDAMHCIDKDNTAYRAWNSLALHWRHLDTAARQADLVTVTTEALAQHYGKHGRTEVLPNCVPEAVLNLASERLLYPEQLAVGWSGFVGTHPRDLQVIGDGVARAIAECHATVRIIGSNKGVDEALSLPDGTSENLGPKKLGPEYYCALTAVDVAVVPLADTTFNRAKSFLKALEFSAMGVPVVASPTPANRVLARDLPICVASSPAEWKEHLGRLLSDPLERQERGSAAQAAVRQRWTQESNAEHWAQAWERAMARRAALSS